MDRWTSCAGRKAGAGCQEGIGLSERLNHNFSNDKSAMSDHRRKLLIGSVSVLSSNALQIQKPAAMARNLPTSNGADTSKSGTVEALLPILKLRNNLKELQKSLQQEHDGRSPSNNRSASILGNIPRKEATFKRLFDAYSDQVSYKQKFLDQNAFLVYYTQGYDGPGREKMEAEVVNERQTLQFGARNDAWVAWESFLAEQDYFDKTHGVASMTAGKSGEEEEDFAELVKYLSNTIQALDTYMKLSPVEDVTAAERLLSSDPL